MTLLEQYATMRALTEHICSPLEKEDYVVQPVADVSPPKWHLGHTTWFFETFLLIPHVIDYQPYNADYNFVFNSYYETVGARVIRTDRGNLSRPTVDDVYKYRAYVDKGMTHLLSCELSDGVKELLVLGINHEQQHQELLWYDIKYILGHNPLMPAYATQTIEDELRSNVISDPDWIKIPEGIYEIGYKGEDFHFDNELNSHKVYLNAVAVAKELVTNGEYKKFIATGGYANFNYWHAEGWDWVQNNDIKSPLYWHEVDNVWMRYSLEGLAPVRDEEPVCHISFYEAWAYAQWSGNRLPTEFEWEAVSSELEWGKLWEWTESAYLPYPGFSKVPGAIGEYNGKFMVNQKVLRGASIATPPDHSRPTYRNFFHPHLRWMYSGLRLAK